MRAIDLPLLWNTAFLECHLRHYLSNALPPRVKLEERPFSVAWTYPRSTKHSFASMPYSRKQVVTCASIVYLILVTALAGYAASRASVLSLPISDALRGLTAALPVVAGLLLEAGYDFTRYQERKRRLPRGETTRPPLVIIANTIIFIYSSVVITLLGTYAAPPSELGCKLDRQWRLLFSHKDDEAIRTIQDTLKCCGYVNSHDQAWPFPDKSHNIHACENAFGRTRGCLELWRGEEQRIAGILMAVVALVFVWQVAIIATPTSQESWLHQVVPNSVSRLIADEEQDSNGPRRAIDYLPSVGPYRDSTVREVSDDDEEEGTVRRTLEAGVQQVRSVFPGGEDEEHHDAPTENTWART
ncbi:hypothetical protein K491DRAFT_692484 [Lophiostoma macrostomum CBS 122681]|uniref:Tetraspanin Tsp3 n=1 Tax=Lophiostoma macrostomum CBS 122681 TaxID=1314788 RepID=A0A6A6TAQ8_9PLEO|nr:hypothetical protein K491DRAFT_692484 [Lophiostoma macrostomum CBS 122681]